LGHVTKTEQKNSLDDSVEQKLRKTVAGGSEIGECLKLESIRLWSRLYELEMNAFRFREFRDIVERTLRQVIGLQSKFKHLQRSE
jgi:hypothetical protein